MYSNSPGLFLELPLLATHRTLVIHLLRVEPLHDAVDVKAVGTLAPDYNK